jgi:hypothetical protein
VMIATQRHLRIRRAAESHFRLIKMHILARVTLLLLVAGSAVGAGTLQQHADPDPPVSPAQAWQIGKRSRMLIEYI